MWQSSSAAKKNGLIAKCTYLCYKKIACYPERVYAGKWRHFSENSSIDAMMRFESETLGTTNQFSI
jgi:hypothetical protein